MVLAQDLLEHMLSLGSKAVLCLDVGAMGKGGDGGVGAVRR